VPHFEKMLNDNAQLVRIYLHLYQISKDEFFRRVAVETLEYIRREMLDGSGGFYSSQDADSEGEEGKFFVWTPEEVAEVLGAKDAAEFSRAYDVTTAGNFEGSNILNLKNPTADAGGSALDAARSKLLETREKRVKPHRDEKVLTAWNGLMLAAFAEAAAVLNEPKYLEIAKRNADFLLENLQKPDSKEGLNDPGRELALPNGQASSFARLLRTWKDGKAKLNGYIEDYANLADGLIELYQVSGEEKYLTEAKRLADMMITEFWDEENGGFFFTSNDHEEHIVRTKDFFDNATPSGNSVGADVLLRLSKFYGEERYEQFGLTALRQVGSQIRRFPSGFGRALSTLEFHLSTVKEIAIVGEVGSEIEREVWMEYRPFKIVAVGAADSNVPLLKGRDGIQGKPTAFVCEHFVCQHPVSEIDEFRNLLE